MTFMLALIGFSYFAYSLRVTFENYRETATWANALEFLIPIVLSLGFLPFLHLWCVFVAYNSNFTTISIYGLDKQLVPYARWLAITRIRDNVELLERWRKSIQSARPCSKTELLESLVALKALVEREASPPVVLPTDGWSPYLAMQFLTDFGIATSHYHHSFEEEWSASSSMHEIGDSAIWKNYVTYYVGGSERVATSLKINLNVNDPLNAEESESTFAVYCSHLLERAVSLDAVERFSVKIAGLLPFTAEIPFGSIVMTCDDFVGGIKGGYSRKFEVQRGAGE
jgi:hypothetical protein